MSAGARDARRDDRELPDGLGGGVDDDRGGLVKREELGDGLLPACRPPARSST
jgi:hypothetical protein